MRRSNPYREVTSSRLAVDPKRWLRKRDCVWTDGRERGREDRVKCAKYILCRWHVQICLPGRGLLTLTLLTLSAGCHGCSMLQGGFREFKIGDGMDRIGLDGANGRIPVAKQGGLSAVISHKPGLGGQSGDLCCE